eukprot:TRINITY_DN240_c2_g1_i1.p3 TRINITY_DN240_c2_g1~~TRINITY_DN240_c2_g1_i1.p3  ORF type:complete len:57 (-),score=12.51 TRINITY_DN240_c2_g1_i1:340-510(-)
MAEHLLAMQAIQVPLLYAIVNIKKTVVNLNESNHSCHGHTNFAKGNGVANICVGCF